MRRVVGLAVAALAAGHAGPALSAAIPLRRRLLPRLAGVGNPRTVALTFDDGPDPASTPAFLAELDRLGVRATFFVLGAMLDRAPDLGRRLRDGGHEVAVHGWTHRNHLRLGPWRVFDELARTADLVQRVTGSPPRWFRPPYGVLTGGGLVAARRTGLVPVLWTAWGRDWESTATGPRVLDTLGDGIRGGATLLLHDSDCTSAPGAWRSALAALPGVVARAAARGATPVPFGEHIG